jgi:hypothetical protein
MAKSFIVRRSEWKRDRAYTAPVISTNKELRPLSFPDGRPAARETGTASPVSGHSRQTQPWQERNERRGNLDCFGVLGRTYRAAFGDSCTISSPSGRITPHVWLAQ